MEPLQTGYDLTRGPAIPDALFYAEAQERVWNMRLAGNRETDATIREIIPDRAAIRSWEDQDGTLRVLLEWDGTLVLLTRWPNTGNVSYQIASDELEKSQKVWEELRALTPPRELIDDGNVTITFWTLSSQRSAEARNRTIRVGPWLDIRRNYPTTSQHHVDRLMETRPPFDAGRLILLHGKPGTGKTYVIRSLAKQWLPWCDTHYIVDPENFFGEAHYMMSVMLDTDAQRTFRATKDAPEDILILNGIDRFRLLVIEDSDEFLRIDAKEKSGQALSRLLNTADGLVGQGLNFLFLITTNTSLADIHPAVSRTGRCVANLSFEEFSAVEASTWLGKQTHGGTLADLYDRKRTHHQIVSDPHKRPGQYV